jgi:hypothetical protein
VLARDSDGAVPTGEVDDVLHFAVAAAGTVIASADVSGGQSAAAVAIFTVMAACSVLIPVLGYLILGARLDPTLGNAKDWLGNDLAGLDLPMSPERPMGITRRPRRGRRRGRPDASRRG